MTETMRKMYKHLEAHFNPGDDQEHEEVEHGGVPPVRGEGEAGGLPSHRLHGLQGDGATGTVPPVPVHFLNELTE